jgi:farnesyl-diphosphate farnesyltransferase
MGAREPAGAWGTCYGILPKVSRTFALSIAQLREPLKGSVCVSYLLCRILDTVEDAPGLEAAERWRLMEPVLAHLKRGAPISPTWGEGASGRLERLSSAADRELLEAAPAVLAAFGSCGEEDRLTLARWVTEMGKGMVAWSERMGEGERVLKRLPSMAALDRYCYYIAGTVGYLLTDLFFLHSPHVDRALYFRLQADAEDFGLGLQKVNIVKDLAEDYDRGWCFIPEDALARAGVTAADFSDPDRHEAVYAGVLPVLRTAAGHLKRAWAYLSNFPVEEAEIRFFLATSLFFALETLGLVAEKPSRLTAPSKLKISRARVATLAAELRLKISRPGALSALHARASAPLAVFRG